MARRGKAKPGRGRGLFAPPAKQVLDRSDSKLGKRRRTADYDFGDVIMPPLPGAKAVAQLPVSFPVNIIMILLVTIIVINISSNNHFSHDSSDNVSKRKRGVSVSTA